MDEHMDLQRAREEEDRRLEEEVSAFSDREREREEEREEERERERKRETQRHTETQREKVVVFVHEREKTCFLHLLLFIHLTPPYPTPHHSSCRPTRRRRPRYLCARH